MRSMDLKSYKMYALTKITWTYAILIEVH